MGAPVGWTFVLGNGGQSITQANGWSHESKCFAMATTVTTSYNFLGYGSCRSANVLQYPNHYLKTGNLNYEECMAQCNADQGCTHMEWSLNGDRQNQCVIFSPQQQQAPVGWTFVLGNGGQSITQAYGWSRESKCFAKSTADRSCQDAQDGYLHPKKTNPKICYKDHTWANYLTGYWGYEAVCGGAICEMEPGLALALTPQPYRGWWAASCKVVQCKFNPRRLQEAKIWSTSGNVCVRMIIHLLR